MRYLIFLLILSAAGLYSYSSQLHGTDVKAVVKPILQEFLSVATSKDSCQCPEPPKVSPPQEYMLENNDWPAIDLEKCAPFVKQIYSQRSIKGELRRCESFVLQNSKNEKLRHVLFSYGSGMDCPSGCIYQEEKVLISDPENKVMMNFKNAYYGLFEIIRGKRSRLPGWNEVLTAVSYRWLEAKRPGAMTDMARQLKVTCKPYPEKQVRPYLRVNNDKYAWALDILKPAECFIQFNSPNTKSSGIYNLTFTGTVLDDGASSVQFVFQLDNLNIKVK